MEWAQTEIVEERVLVPDDALVDVRTRIREALCFPRMPSENAVQVGPDLMGLASPERMALGTPGLEQGCSLRGVTCFQCQKPILQSQHSTFAPGAILQPRDDDVEGSSASEEEN